MMRYPNTSAYCSRDVLTEPPTTVTIVLQDASPLDFAADAPPYIVSEMDVEPTDGWRTRFGKSQLSICFMHSFGKCSGRVAGDPSSCHQIHIRREALDALRGQYKNKIRSFFCRTIKAHLQTPLREMLSRIAKKELTLKYLEYRTQDVEPTDALTRYEAAYRKWLSSTNISVNTNGLVPFPDAAVEQCTTFAVEGSCPNGGQCDAVHCHVASAQVRDRAVSAALQQLHRPPSFQSFVQQQSYPMFPPSAPTAPVYVVLLPPQDAANPNPSRNHAPAQLLTPPLTSSAIPSVSFYPSKDQHLGNSRAVTPNTDQMSSAGALTPSHSSGAFDRNQSSAIFALGGDASQGSFQLLPSSSANSVAPTPSNDIFASFRHHFSSTPSKSQTF